jgi:hypothetical protein
VIVMVTMYRVHYTSADGSSETLTVYSHGDNYGAGVHYCTTDPDVPNARHSTDGRQLADAARFDDADIYAQRIADLLVALIPGASIEVDTGDAIAV